MKELENISLDNLNFLLEAFYGQNIDPMLFYATEKLKSTTGTLDSDSYFRIAAYTKKLAFVKVPGKIYDQTHFSYDKRNYRIILALI